MNPPVFIKETKDGLEISIHVIPGARKSEIVGLHGSSLKVKVAAPPVEGLANEEICSYFNKLYHLKASQVSIIRGQKSRGKTVRLSDTNWDDLANIFLQFCQA
jgi:uncharacterized protein (TIGR00251 family)